MRICFILRDLNDCGGIQQATINLANSLSDSGSNVTVLSLHNERKTPFFGLRDNVNALHLFDGALNVRKKFLTIKKRLSLFLKKQHFDIIVVQSVSFCSLISKPIYKNTRVIACEHTHFYNGHTFGLHWFGAKVALKYASCIVCLTELDAENYQKNNKRRIPILAIGNFLDETIEDCSYDSNSRTIVSCGSLISVKGFMDIPKISNIVLRDHPDWRWIIYGDGLEKEEIQKQINIMGLEKNVVLAGYSTNKREIFGNKSLYVCTSRSEGFGITLLEAMARKIPCVAYDVKYGPKELIDNGENGYLLPAFSIYEMAKTISNLIHDVEKRKQLSDKAYLTYLSYSKETIVEKWNSLFRLVLESN